MAVESLANHLWQSTLFAALAAILTVAFRKNRAAVRYWLWFAASMKFLLPFSLLVALGGQFGWRAAPAILQPPTSFTLEAIHQPFAFPLPSPDAPTYNLLPAALFGVWLCGFMVVAISWLRWWLLIRETLKTATPLHLNLSIRAISSRARLEPGVFGIFRPVLFLPEGIADRLTSSQLQAVLAHELCHVHRRDNLTAAIHTVVEALFWFHPMVWWMERRLVAERERACDEEVLQQTGEPEVYAQGILNVCKFYLESPLVCVSGITGSDLKRRIREIVAPRMVHNLDWRRRVLLATAAIAAISGPIAIGIVNAPPVRAQSQAAAPLAFEVASVKQNRSGESLRAPSMILPGGRFTATNNTLRALILNAYSIKPTLLSGGPSWIDSERFDIDAKAEARAIPPGAHGQPLWEKTRLMLRTLLADRFKLSVRVETKEMPVYDLVVAKNGPKLQKSDKDCTASATACHGFSGNPTRLFGTAVDMTDLALILNNYSDQPVLDKTGIKGIFDIKMQWNPFTPGEVKEGRPPEIELLPTLFTALDQQLGLRLVSRKGSVEAYVIDHVEHLSEQ
jgi:bla regulator protein BlaR1